MGTILPFNLDDLLHCRGVESERVEFKATWDPRVTGPQALRTICAFANDYHNLNGGYVVIGVEERDGRAVLPPRGLSAEEADAAQKWIRGHCNRIDPPYPPILSPEMVEGRLILVGLPKVFRAMEANGSPPPHFEFDAQRTFFQATLPAHPEYAALSALRDAAHLRGLGESAEAYRRIESAWESHQASALLASEMIRGLAERGETRRAEEVLKAFSEQGPERTVAHVANTLIEALMRSGEEKRARRLLKRNQLVMSGQDAIDAAILARRARDSRTAHRYFERAGDAVHADPRALLEFAQTKLWLANEAFRRRQPDSNRRFLAEARSLLERVIQLDASPVRHAWAWRELGRTLGWMKMPVGEVMEAYERAIALLPSEPRFREELGKVRRRTGG